MSLNEPYWNPHFECWMRVTSTGALERLESGIIIPSSRAGKDRPEGVKLSPLDEEVLTKRWLPVNDEDHVENNHDTQKTLIDALLNTYRRHHQSSSETQKELWENTKDRFRERLSILSPMELKDANNKLKALPFSERTRYRDHIESYVSKREDHHFGSSGVYSNKVGSLRTSNLKTLLIGTNENSAQEVTKHMISVKHPKAGRVNLYKDEDYGWQVFDGLAMVDNEVELDGFRSGLLKQLQLSPHINDIISELNANDDPPRSEQPLMVKDIDVFNRSFNDITHVPPPGDSNDKTWDNMLELANILIANDKQYFEIGVDDARPEASFLMQNPKAALAIFNDLAKSTPDNIMQLMSSMYKHHFLSAGHLDVPNNSSTLFQLIDNRNERHTEPGEAHGVTKYQRPRNISGGVVPYKSMNFEEKDDFRRHFADLHDRPKAWIQHTSAGQDTYNGELEDVKANFNWDDFVSGVLRDSYFAPSLTTWVPLGEVLNSDGAFIGVLQDMEEGLGTSLSELIPILDDVHDPDEEGAGDIVRDLLSEDQRAVIDYIMGNDDARLALGIDDREEGLAKKHKNDTMNILLGEPIRPTPEDWKAHEERGSDDGMMLIAGIGFVPMDEVYKHRSDGLLQMTGVDDDGNYQMVFRDYQEELEIEIPRALSGTGKNKDGEYAHVLNFDDFLDQSILDQFVKDGVLPQRYASSTDIEAREDAPEAPEFGSDLCLARANFISNKLRDFKTQMPRGYDNEDGFFQYSLDPDNPQAELMKRMDGAGNPISIMDAIYDSLNGTRELGIRQNQFVYVSDEVRAEVDEIEEKVADGEMPPVTPPPPTDDKGVPMDEDPEEPISHEGRIKKHRQRQMRQNELQRRKNAATDEGIKQGFSAWENHTQQTGQTLGINFTDEDLLNSPHFQQYQDTLQEKQAHEVLANAPLDVRVTAYRMRIQGLQDRLDESTNMGEAYDIARDWFRVGIVEYPDIVQIDRDGTSKFKKVRDAIDNVGVDWLEVNDEWVHHQNFVSQHEDSINALQEKINYLNENYPDMGDGNAEQEAAMRLKEKFEFEQRNLRERGIPEFGSQEHVDILHNPDPEMNNDPLRLQAYADRENTPIGEPDKLTSSIRGAKNALTGALAAGLTTWRESRLYGLNVISSGIHAAMSTIGEATGIGADTIRGMDLSKPLEQMPVGYEDSGLRSYFSIGIPGTNIGKRDTVYEWNRKQAAREGKPYQPPQAATEEQEAALQHVQDTAGRRVIPTSEPADRMQPPTPTPTPDPITTPTPDPVTTPPTEEPVNKPRQTVGGDGTRYEVKTSMLDE